MKGDYNIQSYLTNIALVFLALNFLKEFCF